VFQRVGRVSREPQLDSVAQTRGCLYEWDRRVLVRSVSVAWSEFAGVSRVTVAEQAVVSASLISRRMPHECNHQGKRGNDMRSPFACICRSE
jgi:hypothetical protein